jgi:hypothetical protein
LQDPELKKYIFKDLGQSVLSGLRDLEATEDQIQKQNSNNGLEDKNIQF